MDNDKTILGKLETLKHIRAVRGYLYLMIEELDKRARDHDQSKLDSPEAETFGEYTPELAKTKYGTPEYQDTMKAKNHKELITNIPKNKFPTVVELLVENKKLNEEKQKLIGYIITLTDDAWPYLHRWCTIESIKIRWKQARDYIETI